MLDGKYYVLGTGYNIIAICSLSGGVSASSAHTTIIGQKFDIQEDAFSFFGSYESYDRFAPGTI